MQLVLGRIARVIEESLSHSTMGRALDRVIEESLSPALSLKANLSLSRVEYGLHHYQV
jgi:hypothetical protein